MPASKMGRRLGALTGAFAALTTLFSSASAIPFGVKIYSCTTPGVLAPAFDDGPSFYSEDILDRYEHSHSPGVESFVRVLIWSLRMGAAGFKATWFINGDNMGNLYDYNATLHRMVSMGHQIGSHTYVFPYTNFARTKTSTNRNN